MKLTTLLLLALTSGATLGQVTTKLRLPGNSSSIHLPMAVRANGPYVEVMANRRGPFLFEVDTGSMTSPLSSELAKEMGVRESDSASHSIRIGFTNDFSVPMPVDFASFAGLWPLTGHRTYGVLGYSILKHFVVEFDYERGVLTLHDPKTFDYSGTGSVFPASFEMGYDPQIEGKLLVSNGLAIPVRFTLDTGAGGTVVSTPIVKAHDLFRAVPAKVPNAGKPKVDGVNGLVFETTTARIEGIQLGPLLVDHPLVALSTDTDGPFAMKDIGVNLGGNVLRRFKVIVDYPRKRVMLEPNSHFHDPFLADASGLVLDAGGQQFKRILVHGVVLGSPADKAGLQESDVITAIDDESTDKYALWQIQDLLKESGQTRKLTIHRGKQTRIVSLKLQSLA